MHKPPEAANDNVKRDRLIRLPELCDRIGYSERTVYNRLKDGTLPKPILIGSRSMAWRESEIDDWIANRPYRAIGSAQAA